MINAVATFLQNDTMLSAILPGRVHRAVEISRRATPDAYDGRRELLPCALVKQETATPWGPHEDSGRLYITVWFYGRITALDAARQRVYTLLHRIQLTSNDGSGCYDIRHANDLLDQEEPNLSVPMAMSRYVATVQRSYAS